jgi:hypothetical protein
VDKTCTCGYSAFADVFSIDMGVVRLVGESGNKKKPNVKHPNV